MIFGNIHEADSVTVLLKRSPIWVILFVFLSLLYIQSVYFVINLVDESVIRIVSGRFWFQLRKTFFQFVALLHHLQVFVTHLVGPLPLLVELLLQPLDFRAFILPRCRLCIVGVDDTLHVLDVVIRTVFAMSIHHGLFTVVRNHRDRLVVDEAVAVLCLYDNHSTLC